MIQVAKLLEVSDMILANEAAIRNLKEKREEVDKALVHLEAMKVQYGPNHPVTQQALDFVRALHQKAKLAMVVAESCMASAKPHMDALNK